MPCSSAGILNDWEMCSSAEASERQSYLEVSKFEATDETFSLPARSRVVNPRRAVKKYRRSAAGGGVLTIDGEEGGGGRSVEALGKTVTYLLKKVLCKHISCSASSAFSATKRVGKVSEVVGFLADRFRAVAVDIVTNQYLDMQSELEVEQGTDTKSAISQLLGECLFVCNMIRHKTNLALTLVSLPFCFFLPISHFVS